MKCNRCGYCCIQYEVIIVKDPDGDLHDPDNYMAKHTGERCP